MNVIGILKAVSIATPFRVPGFHLANFLKSNNKSSIVLKGMLGENFTSLIYPSLEILKLTFTVSLFKFIRYFDIVF